MMDTADKRSPYLRALVAGGIFLALVCVRVVLDETRQWNLNSPRGFAILGGASIIAALLLGLAATYLKWLRSWPGIALGTVASWFVTAGLMLLSAQVIYRPQKVGQFRSTNEMMAYFAAEAQKRVKQDRDIDLDFSENSVRVVEEELERLSGTVDKANPQPGVRGTVIGYGAYIGEVIRRQRGGTWEKDHPIAGEGSFPFTWSPTNTVFPVGWCWGRLMNGEEDNVYFKFIALASTNSVGIEVLQIPESETNSTSQKHDSLK